MKLPRFSEESGTGDIIYALRVAVNSLALKSQSGFEYAVPK